jgi:hypothetical protein
MAAQRGTRPRTPNRPAGLNRALLTVVGLVLTLAGAYTVARGTGLLGPATPVPLGLPVQDPDVPLLPAGVAVLAWVPYAVIAGAAVIGLLCLRWLLAQTQRRATGQLWRLGTDHGRGSTVLDTDSAARAFADEIEGYLGISAAHAVITGAHAQPALHLTVALEDQAPVNELRERIETRALPRLRQALELESLPTEMLVRLAATPAAHHLR